MPLTYLTENEQRFCVSVCTVLSVSDIRFVFLPILLMSFYTPFPHIYLSPILPSQGSELHWLACALYVACRSSVPTVGKGTADGNYVSLTRILRCSEIRLVYCGMSQLSCDSKGIQYKVVTHHRHIIRSAEVRSSLCVKSHLP